ncbi:Hpt domain protein [Poriferisphaera corsica]|uniref:Hpt domain protein n=1 Tax=Poriferisphaera corsica TaxID=2528020 RepID=A0A517YPV9_9BACT|nr:Hpt domain-containing protein [Poriferisphaera corsica]QDU32252.1 Hpt domain protein [Poriferisphaera corsica]
MQIENNQQDPPKDVLARIVGVADGHEIVTAQFIDDNASEQSQISLEGAQALDTYLESLTSQVNQLHEAMMRQDIEQLEDVVEDIKRGAGSYGLRRVASMAAKLDEEIEGDESIISLVNCVSELSELCRDLIGDNMPNDDDFLPGA